jgi:hypothetical protein
MGAIEPAYQLNPKPREHSGFSPRVVKVLEH